MRDPATNRLVAEMSSVEIMGMCRRYLILGRLTKALGGSFTKRQVREQEDLFAAATARVKELQGC